MAIDVRRRQFLSALGGATLAWPLAALAQQPALPVVGFIFGGSADVDSRWTAGFRKGLNETGHVEGQNVTTCRRTRSAISAGRRSYWPSSQWYSTVGRDRHARQQRRHTCGQSCNSDDPDRLRLRRKPGQVWALLTASPVPVATRPALIFSSRR
jgi:hypothetical protein